MSVELPEINTLLEVAADALNNPHKYKRGKLVGMCVCGNPATNYVIHPVLN